MLIYGLAIAGGVPLVAWCTVSYIYFKARSAANAARRGAHEALNCAFRSLCRRIWLTGLESQPKARRAGSTARFAARRPIALSDHLVLGANEKPGVAAGLRTISQKRLEFPVELRANNAELRVPVEVAPVYRAWACLARSLRSRGSRLRTRSEPATPALTKLLRKVWPLHRHRHHKV